MHKTSSPYLKQLLKGDIKWMPFNIKTLDYAIKQDRIIFLHIGYIANIEDREMAYALFRDPQVIQTINNHFVPIAIDLEDVPEALLIGMDLLVISDQYFSIPINIFSLPGAKPFTSFSNTTPEEFVNLANNVIFSFKEKRQLLNKASRYMVNRLQGTGVILKKEKPYPITEKLLHAYVKSWFTRYLESSNVGKESPYTINSRYYVFLLKYAVRYNKTESMIYIRNILDHIIHSPMFDPVDGGFYSQARNSSFKEPLYEKQLSENIQAAVLFSFAYKYYGCQIYKEIVERILDFIENVLQSQDGGYMTAITLSGTVKDSTYYKYSLKEIKTVFPDRYKEIVKALGMDEDKEYLVQQIISNTAAYKNLTEGDKKRLKRIRESKCEEVIIDNRVITAYNCMYATSLCIIANSLTDHRDEYIARAEAIINRIQKKQSAGDVKLYRYISPNYNEYQTAELLDYSFFLNALLYLFKQTKKTQYDKLISKYTAYILLNYYQSHNGMFSKTSKTERITPFKRESIIDYIRYSSNSIMARNLWILYKMRKDNFYLDAFKQQLYNVAPQIIGTGPLMVGWGLQILNYLTDKSNYNIPSGLSK